MIACAIERLLEPLAAERLEQVVERVHVERAEGELVVGRHEHDRRHPLGSHGGDDAEAVELGHLHVEEDEVGPVPLDRAHRFGAAGTGGDHLHVGLLAEQRRQPLARHRLIVRDDRAYLVHAEISRASPLAAALGAACRSGTSTVTVTPPDGRCSNVNR